MRKLIGAVAACVVGLAAPAGAAQKQRVVVDRFTHPYELTVECSPFGPYEFDNVVSGVEKVTVTEVLDAEGTLLRTVLHMNLQETQTNSDTGARLPLKGAVHEVWDHSANTRTLSGKVWLGTSRGGTYVQETGRIVMTLDTNEAISVAGPHDAFFEGGIDARVCAALAVAR